MAGQRWPGDGGLMAGGTVASPGRDVCSSGAVAAAASRSLSE